MARGAPHWSWVAGIAAVLAYGLRHQSVSNASFAVSFSALFAALGALRLFWTVVIWPRYFSPLCHLPSPPDATSFVKSITMVADEQSGVRHLKWINSVPNDGLIRYLVLGGMERVFLTSPKAVSDAFVVHCYDYERPDIAQKILSRYMGRGGLALAEGDDHRLQRKNFAPAFGFRHVKNIVPTFWLFAAKLANCITRDVKKSEEFTKEPSETVIPFDTWVNRATLDIIAATGLGFDFCALDDINSELSVKFRAAMEVNLQEIMLQIASFVIPLQYLEYLPFSRNIIVRESVGSIRKTTRQLIERKEREKKAEDTNDILSISLQSGAFTIDQLVDQVMTFLIAGHETTSTATQWAMVTLAQNPEMQKRLRQEIRDHLPSINAPGHVDSDSFNNLPILRAFCQEVLRYWSPVPFTQRVAIRDTYILGKLIPKGTHITLSCSAMNHSKELWGDDADQFQLERWLQPGCSVTGGVTSPYANLTFGAGPRGCIGSNFAKHEFHCLVAALIGRFEIQLDPPDRKVEPRTSTTTRPKGGLPLRMKILDGW